MKTLVTITSILAALSMQAQTLYVLGCGEGLSYFEDKALEVELVDGKYSFDVKNLSDLYVLTSSMRHPKHQDGQTVASMTDVRGSASSCVLLFHHLKEALV